MKKYLRINQIIIYTFLLGFSILTNIVLAKLPNVSDNDLSAKNSELLELSLIDVKNSTQSYNLNLGKSDLVIKSSQIYLLSNKDYSNFNSIFIICDQEYLYKDTECNYDYLVTPESNRIDFYKSINQELFISFYRGDPNYYLIPEQYILTPKYKGGLTYLFNSFNNAQEAIQNHNLLVTKEASQKISQLPGVDLLELLTYLIIGFLFVILTIKPIIILKKNGFDLRKYNFKENIIKYYYKVKRYNLLFLLFFIFSLLFTVCLLVIISILDNKGYSTGYMISYLKDSVLLRWGGVFRVLLLMSLLITFSSLFIYVLLANLDLVLINFITSIKKEFKINFVKYIFPSLTLLNLIILTIDPKIESFNFVFSVSLVSLVLIYIKGFFYKIDFSILYTKKQKYLLITLHILLGILASYFNFNYNTKIEYKYEELIGLRDSVISLPYNKVFPENYLFEPFEYTNTEPLYFNNYKVYDNLYNEIVNKDINNFDDTGSWEIVIMNNKDYDKFLHKNNIIIDKLTTNEFTNYLYFKDNKSNDSLIFNITFNCSQNIGPFTLKANITKISKESEVKKEKNIPIFYFPGCIAQKFDKSNISYQFPLLFNENTDYLVELTNLNDSIISDFKVTKNNVLIESVFVNYPKKEPLVISNNVGGSSLSVYSENVAKNITVLKTEEKDLGLIMNTLLKEGTINSPVLIWSTSDMVLLRNNVFLDL